jgi:hypothetical protein
MEHHRDPFPRTQNPEQLSSSCGFDSQRRHQAFNDLATVRASAIFANLASLPVLMQTTLCSSGTIVSL